MLDLPQLIPRQIPSQILKSASSCVLERFNYHPHPDKKISDVCVCLIAGRLEAWTDAESSLTSTVCLLSENGPCGDREEEEARIEIFIGQGFLFDC